MNRLFLALAGFLAAALIAIPSPSQANVDPMTGRSYEGGYGGGGYSSIRRRVVNFETKYRAGTIIVKTGEKRLYLVLGEGKAMRYGVGVGRPGFQWHGRNRISRKAEWPGWTPPAAMRKRVPGLPAYMPGGPQNPLGARALYIGSTLYRIHGSNEPWTIGREVSSGCIRMTNNDVIDLYNRTRVGARVIVTR